MKISAGAFMNVFRIATGNAWTIGKDYSFHIELDPVFGVHRQYYFVKELQ